MQYLWATATILWFAGMTYLSHQNGEETSRTSRILAEDVHRMLPGESTEKINTFLRKIAHVVVFLVLTVLLGTTLEQVQQPVLQMVFAGVLLVWCWADEATKIFVPGRHFSWLDVGLNVVGCLAGIGCRFIV